MRFCFLSMTLLVAVFATACSDEETFPSACNNTADLALIDQQQFVDEYAMCAEAARDTTDPESATTTCLTEDPGLSEACAACYGRFTQCVIDDCAELCEVITSEGCLECANLDCTPGFVVECAGIDRLFPGTPGP